MYYVGIDIGSTASKTVVTGDREIKFVLPTGWSSKETASEIASRLLDEGIDVKSEEVRAAATGYGRVAVDYADFVITEITCHGRGGREMAGNDCAIIDVGGQDTKVILVKQGMIQDFLMNDKCSAGTGKFLEIMANRLGVTIAELFDLIVYGVCGIRGDQYDRRGAKQRRYSCGSSKFCGGKGCTACQEKAASRDGDSYRGTE